MIQQSHSCIYTEKTILRKNTCTPVFTATLFTIAKTWKQPKCPSTDEWIKKMWYIYTVEYYSAIKKNEIMPFSATRMDLEIVILSEVSQTEKDKYHMISLTCRIFKTKWYKWTFLQNRSRLTDLENELMVTRGWVGGGGWRDRVWVWDWHAHNAIFKIDNQQGPTVQHRELCSIFCNNLNGKRIWKRLDTCICITESLCCTPETNTTLLINYTPI